LKSIAVIGPNANRVHLGGYSDDPGRGVSVLEGITNKVGAKIKVNYAAGCKITEEGGNWFADTAHLSNTAEDEKLIAEAVEVAKSSDVALLVLGGNEDTNKEGGDDNDQGDRDSLDIAGLLQSQAHRAARIFIYEQRAAVSFRLWTQLHDI